MWCQAIISSSVYFLSDEHLHPQATGEAVESKYKIIIEVNEFENVICKMTAIIFLALVCQIQRNLTSTVYATDSMFPFYFYINPMISANITVQK